MSTVAGVTLQAVQPIAPVAGRDADGDNDGTKAAAPAAQPVVSKPTETLGNNVNTYA